MKNGWKLDTLIEEMHYLVKKANFTYTDLHEMSLFEFEAHGDINRKDMMKEAEINKKMQEGA